MKADQPNQIDIKLGYIVYAEDIIELSRSFFNRVLEYNYEETTQHNLTRMKNNELYDLTNKDNMIVGFYNFILQTSSMYRREVFRYHLGRVCCDLLTYGQVLHKEFLRNGEIRTEFRGKYTEWHIMSNANRGREIKFNISKKIDTSICLYVNINDDLTEKEIEYIDTFLFKLEIRGVKVNKLHRNEFQLNAIRAENDELYWISIKNDILEGFVDIYYEHAHPFINFMCEAGDGIYIADRYASYESFLDSNPFISSIRLSDYLTTLMFERIKAMTFEKLMIKALGDKSDIFNEDNFKKDYREKVNIRLNQNKNMSIWTFLRLRFYSQFGSDHWELTYRKQDFYYANQEEEILKDPEKTKSILSSLISDLELYTHFNYKRYARYSIKEYNILNMTGLFMPISKISIEIL